MKKIISFLFLLLISFIGNTQVKTLIDFGSPGNTTSGNWNNITTTNLSEPNLIDSNGNLTGVALNIDDVFDDYNPSGTNSPDASLNFPSTATSDSFFGENQIFQGTLEPTGGFILSGLDISKFYSFRIFASRMGAGNESRETLYTISGLTSQSKTLEVFRNTSNIADILNVQPDATGEIKFTSTTGPGNNNSFGFYYLGVIEMTTTDSTLSLTKNILDSKISVFPNPILNSTKINFNLKKSVFLNISIYDISGRLIKTLKNENVSAGEITINWDKSDNSKQKVSSGFYLLRISAGNTTDTSKLIVK